MTLRLAATIVDEWVRGGVTDAVIAPGSRSTPLTMALAASPIRIHVRIDERCAGFFALGVARATGRPCPIVTTSGTAGGHLLPAVMEASASNVPMIVCTADRPAELHHVGAPQTAEQELLYLPVRRLQITIEPSIPDGSWRSIAAQSLIAAHDGPVHLNLQFAEPLVGVPEALPPGRSDGAPWHVAPPVTQSASLRTPVAGRRGLIIATDVDDPSLVMALAAALGWPVFAGPQSGCRTGSAVCAFDALVRAPDAPAPEVVLRLGGLPASRVTNEWLDGLEADQIAVGPRWVDPARNAREVVSCAPSAVCRSLLAGSPEPAPSAWAASWMEREAAAQKAIASVVEGEPSVARTLTESLPASTTLLVASSMPYRDVEWYGAPAQDVRLVANRGVNGIDGMVSTALGLATAGPVVALLGDLAFLHDAGGLVGAEGDCTFVVVDNQGGGIFNFLPQAALPDFERYWGTPPGVDPAAVAAGYGVPVTVGSSLPAVEAPIGVRVIVVRSDRAHNVAVHQALLAAVADAIA